MTKAWFVSDVHLNPADPDRTDRFLGFLDAWEKADCPLYILGDLFDYWLGSDHARGPDYRQVLDRLQALAAHAHPVHFLFGNRDFLIDRAAHAPAGLRFAGHACEIALDTLRVLLCHGDRLCTRDVRYQRLRCVLQSRGVRAALGGLPLPLKERLAARMRVMSRDEIARKDPRVLEIPVEALAPRFERGIDAVVCGHIHKEQILTFEIAGRPRRLYTLRDWRKGTPYLEWNGSFGFKSI